MIFYSGFSLKDDVSFFEHLIDKSDYSISGFSYGSMMAFDLAYSKLKQAQRVDRVQLFSPLFFQQYDEKFKKLQLFGYKKDSKTYIENFIKQSFYPLKGGVVSHDVHTYDQLRELLYFVWDEKKLKEICDSGVIIEVYVGSKDAIVDHEAVVSFFKNYADVTIFTRANHFLQQ